MTHKFTFSTNVGGQTYGQRVSKQPQPPTSAMHRRDLNLFFFNGEEMFHFQSVNVFWKLVQGKVSYDHANWLSSWSMRHLKKNEFCSYKIFLYSDLHIHCTAIAQIQIEVISYLFHFRLINTHWTFSSMITYYYKDEKSFYKADRNSLRVILL